MLPFALQFCLPQKLLLILQDSAPKSPSSRSLPQLLKELGIFILRHISIKGYFIVLISYPPSISFGRQKPCPNRLCHPVTWPREGAQELRGWPGKLQEGLHWFRLCALNAGDTGSIPGWGTKVPHALWCSQKKLKINIKKKVIRADEQMKGDQRGVQIHISGWESEI